MLQAIVCIMKDDKWFQRKEIVFVKERDGMTWFRKVRHTRCYPTLFSMDRPWQLWALPQVSCQTLHWAWYGHGGGGPRKQTWVEKAGPVAIRQEDKCPLFFSNKSIFTKTIFFHEVLASGNHILKIMKKEWSSYHCQGLIISPTRHGEATALSTFKT